MEEVIRNDIYRIRCYLYWSMKRKWKTQRMDIVWQETVKEKKYETDVSLAWIRWPSFNRKLKKKNRTFNLSNLWMKDKLPSYIIACIVGS